MEDEKDAFYVVRKGDVVGIYRSLSDCQAQAGSSVCNPPVSVFKGYGLPKEAEEYLVSHGLKNSSYTMSASHVKNDLFGDLVACPFQQPAASSTGKAYKDSPPKIFQDACEQANTQPTSSAGNALYKDSPAKRSQEVTEQANIMENVPHCSCGSGPMQVLMSKTNKNYGRWFYRCPQRQDHLRGFIWADEYVSQQSQVIHLEVEHPLQNMGTDGEVIVSTNLQRKHLKVEHVTESIITPVNFCSCVLEFDGASKGNPGQAGAGAVLRAEDGSLVCRLREGVGIATNNVAEYRALILGLRYALRKGFKHIRARGDSKLVCQQVQGLWKIKNQNMADLCKEAKELVDKFMSFQIHHVLREFNSEADAQANLAVNLKDGQVDEDCRK